MLVDNVYGYLITVLLSNNKEFDFSYENYIFAYIQRSLTDFVLKRYCGLMNKV